MDPLLFLLQRRSCPKLLAPAPTDEQLSLLFQAAIRAPDHGQLKPYRYLVVESDARVRLGELYAHALAKKGETDPQKLDRARSLPLRAPMLLVAIACFSDNPKTPQQEQLITAGIATGNILAAAQAMGLGAFWRTGELAYNRELMNELGLSEHEKIIGYLYIGTPEINAYRDVPVVDTSACWRRM